MASRLSRPTEAAPLSPTGDPVRRAVADGLVRIDDGAHIEPVLAAPPFLSMPPRDRRFAAELLFGVTRWRRALDLIIEASASLPPERIDPPVLALLRMGLYQAVGMGEGTPHAAVHQAVQLAKEDPRTGRSAGFVNGVLRGALRRVGEIPGGFHDKVASLLPEGLPPSRRLAALTSFPDWMIERWIDAYGFDAAERIAEAANRRAPTFVRVDREEGLADAAARSEVTLTPVDLLPGLMKVTAGTLLPASPLVREGFVQPQDLSSQCAASLLMPSAGATVVDACAGKGIKSGLFARQVGETGRVIALDRSVKRLRGLAKNMGRIGAGSVRPVAADLLLPWPLAAKVDRLFLDAPCSATGVIRRHPESKWNRGPEEIAAMARLQRELLGHGADVMAPGGYLVYSVCSIEPEEGASLIGAFLDADRRFVRAGIAETHLALAPHLTPAGDLFFLPGEREADGFYAALLRRTDNDRP
ncbi:MAG: hypothetical protein HQK87_06375 [Nitrospinae bacterium]|nr:hypothetical protein [Nitrospinota bacterium]